MTRPGPYTTALVKRSIDDSASQASPDDRYRAALEIQQALNKITWGQLVELGVTPATELELDFTYVAPGAAEALALREELAHETDYALAFGQGVGSTWTVTGTTRPRAMTLEALDDWVDWMIAKGLRQDCEFAGWGTEAP